MRRGLVKKLLAFALSASLVAGYGGHMGTIGGAEEVQAASNATFNVTSADFGANGNDLESDREAIQKALDNAKSIEGTTTVVIPKGTYYIDEYPLHIYSNTHLKLEAGAVMRRASGYTAVMIINGVDFENQDGGYNRSGNITLSGGTWDGAVTGTTTNSYDNLVYFGHAHDITIQDTTIQNCYGVHLLELTGVKDSIVKNVTLKNFIKSGNAEEDAFKEAIQLDVVTKVGSEMFAPYDNTPCKNITISDCKVYDYPSGMGSHSDIEGAPMDDITIQNNTFEKITNRAIELKHYRNVKVLNNTIVNSTPVIAIDIVNASGTISGNKIPNASENGIFVTDRTTGMTISSNTVSNCGLSGIRVTDNSTATIKNNEVSNCNNCGIYTDNAKPTIQLNKVSKCKVAGISVKDPSGADVSGNTITDCNTASPATHGISIINGNQYTGVKNNVITNSYQFGIAVYGSNGSIIDNNKITKFGEYGIYVCEGQDGTTRSKNVVVKNNQTSGGKAGIGVRKNDSITITKNSISNASTLAIYVAADCTKSVVQDNTSGNSFGIYDTSATVSGNKEGANGLAKDTDGKWKYFVNGAVDTGFTGLVSYSGAWYYVEKGILNWGYTSLYRWKGTWYYVKNGQVAFGHTGLVKYGSAWYYVKGGTIAWGYTGLANNSVGYFYVKKGVIDFGYTGLVLYGKDWYYVKNGQLDWKYTGLCKYGSAWYYVYNGKLNWYYTGLCKYGSAWYYVDGGKVNFGYTGIAAYSGNYFYVKNGVLKWGYTGLAKNSAGWFYMKNSVIDWSFTGLTKYGNAWYYVKGGALNWGYTGLVYHGGTYYYVNKGVVDFGYTGTTVYYGKTYNVYKGVLA